MLCGYHRLPIRINTQDVTEEFRHTEIVGGKGASKFDSLMKHIYENPVETEVGLIARILSVCVKIHKIRQAHLRPKVADIVRHF